MPGLSEAADRGFLRRPLLRDAGFVLAWFLVVAVIAAIVWWQVTPLAEYTRTADNAQMDEQELGRQVAADGWYVVIAAVGGLLSGIMLLSLRRRDPVATVLLVVLGSLLCAWVMLRLGLWLGPEDPKAALQHAAVGAKVPLQLKPKVTGVVYVWPIMALVGAIGVIWGTDDVGTAHEEEPRDQERPDAVDGRGPEDGAAPEGTTADDGHGSEDGVGLPGSR